MKRLGINHEAVQDCMKSSFEDSDYSKDNWLLARDQQLADDLSISMHPAITINNYTYHGDFDGEDVF